MIGTKNVNIFTSTAPYLNTRLLFSLNLLKCIAAFLFPLISFDVNTHKYNKDKATGELCRSIKPRHISYAAHSDSHIYSYYSKLLSEKYEKQLKESNLTDCVLAFRRFNEKMSNIEFAKIAFDEIKRGHLVLRFALM